MPRIDQEQNINALIDSDIVQLVVKRPDDDALSMKQHITEQARRCTVADQRLPRAECSSSKRKLSGCSHFVGCCLFESALTSVLVIHTDADVFSMRFCLAVLRPPLPRLDYCTDKV